MPYDEAQDVLPVELAAVAEQLLDTVVVALGVVADGQRAPVAVVALEAGQRAGRLAHVALGVAARDPEREELHELACVVLVGVALVGVHQREEGLQRRGRDNRPQEPGERAQRVLAQLVVLRKHERGVLVARGEVVVPEERELLLKRALAANHLVQPPQHVVAPLVDRVQRLAVGARRRADHALGGVRSRPAADQPVDGALARAPGPELDLLRARAEARAPQQAFGVRARPSARAAWGGWHRSIPGRSRRFGGRRTGRLAYNARDPESGVVFARVSSAARLRRS